VSSEQLTVIRYIDSGCTGMIEKKPQRTLRALRKRKRKREKV
jgi:hypothetical protein